MHGGSIVGQSCQLTRGVLPWMRFPVFQRRCIVENQASWGTLEKAIAAAEEEAGDDAAGIVEGRVDRGIIALGDTEGAMAAVLEAVTDHQSAVERRVSGIDRA